MNNGRKGLLVCVVVAVATAGYILSMGTLSDKVNNRSLFVMASRLASKMQILTEKADLNEPFVKSNMSMLDLLILDELAVTESYKEKYVGYELPKLSDEVNILTRDKRVYEYSGYHIVGIKQIDDGILVIYDGLPLLAVNQLEAAYDKGETGAPEGSGAIRYNVNGTGYLLGIYINQ